MKRFRFHYYRGVPNHFRFVGRIHCYKGVTFWVGRLTVTLYWGE